MALSYDPAALSLAAQDITLGSIPGRAAGWQISSVVDPTTGQIGIQLYSLTPFTVNQAGSLVNIAFHVLSRGMDLSTSVQLVHAATPQGQWYGTGVADSQGAMVLSPGIDQLVLPTGSVFVSSASLTNPENTESTGQVNLQVLIDPHSQNDLQQTAGTSSNHVGSEGGDENRFTILSNGPLGGEDGHVVSAKEIVSPPAGKIFQVGTSPLLNTIFYRNNPGQLASDRFLLALFCIADIPANLGLENPSHRSLISDEAPWLDWVAASSQMPVVEAETDLFTGMPDQLATNQQEVSHIAVVDKAFADEANAWDDFGDLCDY